MQLTPGYGIDDIVFELRQSDIVRHLGEPDKSFIDEDDENELIWQYNQQKLRLSFYKAEGGKLGYIRSANSALTFKGQTLIGEPISKLIANTFADFKDWQVENHSFFEMYFHEESWLVLNVEYEVVTDLEIGVLFNKEGEYIWNNP